MNTLILQFKKVAPLCIIVYALGCLALLPRAQAVSPPLDGDDTAQELGDNTAIGADMLCNMMMLGNTAYGFQALADNAMGNDNTAIGRAALACSTGSNNIALGAFAGSFTMAGNNNIYIGNVGMMAREDGQIRIGRPGVHTGT